MSSNYDLMKKTGFIKILQKIKKIVYFGKLKLNKLNFDKYGVFRYLLIEIT